MTRLGLFQKLGGWFFGWTYVRVRPMPHGAADGDYGKVKMEYAWHGKMVRLRHRRDGTPFVVLGGQMIEDTNSRFVFA